MIGYWRARAAVRSFDWFRIWSSSASGDGSRGPKPGAFFSLVDPRLDATSAPIVWRPETARRHLTAVAHRNSCTGFEPSFRISDLPCGKRLLIDCQGGQHLVLDYRGQAVQFICTGANLAIDTPLVSIPVGSLAELESRIRLLRRAAYIAQKKTDEGTLWTPAAARRRDALIALDGSLCQVKYREIAMVLFGAGAVVEEWGDSQERMKKQIIRLVRKGKNLSAGGYRRLLH